MRTKRDKDGVWVLANEKDLEFEGILQSIIDGDTDAYNELERLELERESRNKVKR